MNDKWGVKLGFQYLFTEYTTDTKVQTTPDGQKNDRFRSKGRGISLGVTYSF
jgi:long-subunit fatty acid transport protein